MSFSASLSLKSSTNGPYAQVFSPSTTPHDDSFAMRQLQQEQRSEEHHRGKPVRSLKTHWNAPWALEIAAVATSIGCLVAIVAIMALHDNKPYSSWGFYFSLNTVLSLLATVARSTTFFAVAAAISQGKWNRFRSNPGQLKTFQAIEDASRGGFGSLTVLKNFCAGPLISLGAGVVLISAAFGPMIQACVTDYGRLNDLPVIAGASVGSVGILPFGNANPNELVKRGNLVMGQDENAYSTNVHNDLKFPDFSVVSAISGGFSTSQHADSSTQLAWTCVSGNCTWTLFASLAVCSSCHDVSKSVTRKSISSTMPHAMAGRASNEAIQTRPNDTITNYDLKQTNLTINNWNGFRGDGRDREYMVAKVELQPKETLEYHEFESLLMSVSMMRASDEYMQNKAMWQDTTPEAMECGMFLCVNAYNTSVVNGTFNESLIATSHEKVKDSWRPHLREQLDPEKPRNETLSGTLEWNPINNAAGYSPRGDFQLDPRKLEIGNPSPNQTFSASQSFLSSLTIYLEDLLKPDVTDIYDTTSPGTVQNWTRTSEIPPSLVYSPPIMKTLYHSDNISHTFANVAHSLTSYMRNIGDRPQVGTAKAWEIHYRVRWAFLILPAVVVVGGAIFVVLTIIETHREGMEAWRTNVIAMLIYSLDPDTRAQLREERKSKDLDGISELVVYMHDTPGGVELSSQAPMATQDSHLDDRKHVAIQLNDLHEQSAELGLLSQEAAAPEVTEVPSSSISRSGSSRSGSSRGRHDSL